MVFAIEGDGTSTQPAIEGDGSGTQPNQFCQMVSAEYNNANNNQPNYILICQENTE